MKIPSLILSITLLVLLAFLCNSNCFAWSNTKVDPDVSNRIKDIDQNAKKKVEQLDQAHKKKFYNDLVKALQYYHRKNFSEALPLFQEVSKQVETLDILYWKATCAVKTNDCTNAVSSFKQLLDIAPHLNDARMDLAMAYYNCQQYENARDEFTTLLENDPPDNVKSKINRFLSQLGNKGKKFQWQLQLSAGYQYDSNITCGPEENLIDDDIIGAEYEVPQKDQKQSSSNLIGNLKSGMVYDAGKTGGFVINGLAGIYYSKNMDSADYNFAKINAGIGPGWLTKKITFKMPIGAQHKQYAGEALSNAFYVNPSYDHKINENITAKLNYTLTSESYSDEDYSDSGYDNIDHSFTIGPAFSFKKKSHTITALFGYRLHDADKEPRTYTEMNFALSYQLKLPTQTSLFLKYKYLGREYDGPPANYEKDREDTRNTFTAALNQTFLKRYFAAIEVSYIDNESTDAELYTFTKMLSTLTGGVKF